jgi:hypothetical protein
MTAICLAPPGFAAAECSARDTACVRLDERSNANHGTKPKTLSTSINDSNDVGQHRVNASVSLFLGASRGVEPASQHHKAASLVPQLSTVGRWTNAVCREFTRRQIRRQCLKARVDVNQPKLRDCVRRGRRPRSMPVVDALLIALRPTPAWSAEHVMTTIRQAPHSRIARSYMQVRELSRLLNLEWRGHPRSPKIEPHPPQRGSGHPERAGRSRFAASVVNTVAPERVTVHTAGRWGRSAFRPTLSSATAGPFATCRPRLRWRARRGE